MQSSFSFSSCDIWLSSFLIESGIEYDESLTLEAASSIRSIALSGRNLSLIYLDDIFTAASTASSVIVTLWCSSYLGLRPLSIRTASSSEGSSTLTGWNLLSSAASFSMYLRYSSSVVAPISCISPLASDGLSILDASIAPSAPPAPIIVWSSSRNKSTLPACFTSAITFFILSSNSPRYLEPATMPERSSVTSLLSFIVSGTSPAAILAAMPSAIAVLPTPGSPIRHGLFLVRLLNICITLSISFSLPMTGSSLPSLTRVSAYCSFCLSAFHSGNLLCNCLYLRPWPS